MTDTVERIQHEIAHLHEENATLADALSDARLNADAAREEIAGLRDELTNLAEKMVFRGNSVGFIYDKMIAYKGSVGRAHDRGFHEGRDSCKTEIEQLGAQFAEALEREARWQNAFRSCRDEVLHGLEGFDNDATNEVLGILDHMHGDVTDVEGESG